MKDPIIYHVKVKRDTNIEHINDLKKLLEEFKTKHPDVTVFVTDASVEINRI